MGLILQFSAAACGASLAEMPPPPKYVNTRGIDGFNYWLVRHLITDVDNLLRKQGIDPAMCIFRPGDGSEDLPYRELGKCLMKNFMAAMKSDQKPGIIYTWIRDKKGQFHSAEIHWRPPLGGWSNYLKQIFDMKFEKPLAWIRSYYPDPYAVERVRFKEFITGELQIILPQDPAALETLALKGNQMVKNYLARTQSISFKMDTVAQPQGQMIYAGVVTFKLKSEDENEGAAFDVHLKTNINVLLKKRPFFVNGSIQTQGSEFLPKVGAP